MQIKELRRLKGINQKTLSIDMGVSQPTVSDWESGNMNPSIENLVALSRYFSVTVGCIVGTEPIPEGYPNDQSGLIPYTDLMKKSDLKAAEPQPPEKKKKAPFSADQIAYLDQWGSDLKRSLKDEVADAVVQRIQEDSPLLREQEAK